jgi:DNA-binding HxlR family transcriptional regulator
MSDINGYHNSEDHEDCPIAKTARLVGDTWTLLIVRDLLRGPKRFGELQESLGNISPKTLSQRLKMLEAADLINRHAYAEIPPRVEYDLTEIGLALSDIIQAMSDFGERYLSDTPALEAQP